MKSLYAQEWPPNAEVLVLLPTVRTVVLVVLSEDVLTAVLQVAPASQVTSTFT